MDNRELDKLLEKHFSNVNLWLNFAEAKNAANIAFVVASIAALFNFKDMNILLYIVCAFFVVSGICSLISFVPRLENKESKQGLFLFKNKKRTDDVDNLIFFENIKKYSGSAYIKQVCKMYFNENEYNPTKYQLDLAEEIVNNSNITSIKYWFFKKAVYLDIIALFLLAIFLILA